ncbi:unnamed protein product, partial [Prorocentrum cordatum]
MATNAQKMHLDPQAISMVLWACATQRAAAGTLPRHLADQAAAQLPRLSPQGVANVLWACAHLRLQRPPLAAALAAHRTGLVAGLGLAGVPPQAAANALWALARLPAADAGVRGLFDEVAEAALRRAPEWRPQEAAAVAWSVAVARARGTAARGVLLQAAGQAAELANCGGAAARDEASCRLLAGAAWSLAAAGLRQAPLWDSLAAAAVRLAPALSSQELANTSWAFVTASAADAPGLLPALASAAPAHLPELAGAELSAVSWALAPSRHRDPPWLGALGTVIAKDAGQLELHRLASLAWSWATTEGDPELLSTHVLPAAQAHVRRLSGPGCAPAGAAAEEAVLQLAWSFSPLGVSDEHFLADAEALLRKAGRERDRRARSAAEEAARAAGARPACAPADDAPAVVHVWQDVAFVHKPPGWEVDGGADAGTALTAPRRGVRRPSLCHCLLPCHRPRRGRGLRPHGAARRAVVRAGAVRALARGPARAAPLAGRARRRAGVRRALPRAPPAGARPHRHAAEGVAGRGHRGAGRRSARPHAGGALRLAAGRGPGLRGGALQPGGHLHSLGAEAPGAVPPRVPGAPRGVRRAVRARQLPPRPQLVPQELPAQVPAGAPPRGPRRRPRRGRGSAARRPPRRLARTACGGGRG